MDPLVPWVAYLIGLAQTDGHLTSTSRNRGRLSIELARRDEGVLVRLAALIPYHSSITRRRRTTNFSDAYDSSILVVCARGFREDLIRCGVPVGRKSLRIKPPSVPFTELDYVRGLVDGDGSVGMTKQGIPFVSLNTSSDEIARYFVAFLARSVGKAEKRPSRNKRDDCYNIVVFREDAARIAELLYYEGSVAIERKRSAAESINGWQRPPKAPRVCRSWTAEDQEIALTMRAAEAARLLGRSVSAIYGRRQDIRRFGPRRLSGPARSEWREYSTEEDEFLLSHSVDEAAAALGRATQSIHRRRAALRRRAGAQHQP